jgi:hypothetical protein
MKTSSSVVALLALALLLAACAGDSPATRATVPQVVSGRASTWKTVTVSTPTASADVPSDARGHLTPLLATRAFFRPAPLPEYGLDHPQAALTYKGTNASADVDIGQLNFDRHFIYVQRRGQPAVYLVPADTLRPVVALVGIDLKPPE